MALAPIVIEFLTKGMPQVQAAFDSIAGAAKRAGAAQVAGQKAALNEAKNAAKAQQQALRDAASAENRRHREKMANLQKEVTEQRRAAQAEATEQRRLAQISINAQKEASRFRIEQLKAESRERIQAMRNEDRARRDQERRKPKEPISKWARPVEIGLSGAARGVGTGLRRSLDYGVGLATTAASLGGGFSIAGAVQQQQESRQLAAELAGSTIFTSGKQQFSIDAILNKAKATAAATGFTQQEVLEAFDTGKAETGDLGLAMSAAPKFLKLARASGTSTTDMSKLFSSLIAGGFTEGDALDLTQVFNKQGALGSVEMKDMARYGSRLKAAANTGNEDRDSKIRNIASAGAIAQMSKQFGGSTSAAEAALSVQRFSGQLLAKREAIKGMTGVDVLDEKTKRVRDLRTITVELAKALDGRMDKLSDLKFTQQAHRALLGAGEVYSKGGRGSAGAKALEAEFDKYTSGTTDQEVDAAFDLVMTEHKLATEMESLRVQVGEQLLPMFKQMMPTIKTAMEEFTKIVKLAGPHLTAFLESIANFVKQNEWLISTMAEHPVGSLIATEITKSFTSATLPAIIRASMTDSLAALGSLAGGAGAAGASLTTLAGVFALIAAAGYGMFKYLERFYNKENKQGNETVNKEIAALNLISRVQRGEKVDPKEIQEAKATLEKNVKEMENPGFSFAKSWSEGMGLLYNHKETDEAIELRERTEKESILQQKEYIDKLDRSLIRLSLATEESNRKQNNTPPPVAAGATTHSIKERAVR